MRRTRTHDKKSFRLSIAIFSVIVAAIAIVVLPLSLAVIKPVLSNGEAAGGITVSQDTDEATIQLHQDISAWQTGEDLEVTYPGGMMYIPKSLFEFDVEEAVASIESAQAPWYAFWQKDETVTVSLSATLVNDGLLLSLQDTIDVNATKASIEQAASVLSTSEVEATVAQAVSAENQPLIFSSGVTIPDGITGVEQSISLLGTIELRANAEWSMLTFTEEQSIPDDQLTLMASAIYMAALQTNIDVAERYQDATIPLYTVAGNEAVVVRDQEKDLRLFNGNATPMTITLSVQGNQLQAQLETAPFDGNVQLSMLRDEELTPRTVYRYSSSLRQGQQQILAEGRSGFRTELVRTHTTPEGEVTETETISKDFYPPEPVVILIPPDETASEVTDSTGAPADNSGTPAVVSPTDNTIVVPPADTGTVLPDGSTVIVPPADNSTVVPDGNTTVVPPAGSPSPAPSQSPGGAESVQPDRETPTAEEEK